MRIGFIGTGAITEAVVRGICTSDFAVEQITVSPRNQDIAQRLAGDFPRVRIASDNQDVIDRSDLVFVALRAQIAETALRGLVFRDGQKLVTFIATAPGATVARWINHQVPVLRAVPLPFVAEHKSATPIFPADKDLQAIFSHIGGAVEVQSEEQFNVFMTAGSLMGVYFRFAGLCDSWLRENGLTQADTWQYLTALFSSLSDVAKSGDTDFATLEREYSTSGGTNELITNLFLQKGGDVALKQALDEAFARISKN